MNNDTENTMQQNNSHKPLLKDLLTARKPPVYVTRDTELKDAITIMMLNDYSQLPVMQGERKVDGYISWRSIGEAIALGVPFKYVRDCMADSPKILEENDSLLDAVKIIVNKDFVLVRSKQQGNKIVGIVTTSDITTKFQELAEPFFLIGQIEQGIRMLIDTHFSLQEIQSIKDPSDEQRVIENSSDLTFGEYIRLLEKKENWKRFEKYLISRKYFLQYLREIKNIRNKVMHFRSDGDKPINGDDVVRLRNIVAFLERLQKNLSTGK